MLGKDDVIFGYLAIWLFDCLAVWLFYICILFIFGFGFGFGFSGLLLVNK